MCHMPASTNNPPHSSLDPKQRRLAERKRRGRMDDIEPLLVRPKGAAKLLGCGVTRLYQLINSGALESFADGTAARMITTRSIRAHIERQLETKAAEKRDTSTAAAKS